MMNDLIQQSKFLYIAETQINICGSMSRHFIFIFYKAWIKIH